MTHFYSNSVSDVAANVTSTFSANAVSSHAARDFIAPWIETGFVAVPREFHGQAIKVLSGRAQRVYEIHLKHARTKGQGAGLSYAYRETVARELECSLSTVDRANAELEKHRLILDTGRRYKHGGAVVFQLLPPSQWLFDAPDCASSTAQNCVLEDAVLRPITRAKRPLKTKKQQTASHEKISAPNDEAAPVVVVHSTQVENAASPSPTPEEEAPLSIEAQQLCAQLELHGTGTRVALYFVRHYGEKACAYQLGRLNHQKNVQNAVGWLRSALLRGDRDPEPRAVKAPKPAPPKRERSDEEKALQRARELALEKQNREVATELLARLDAKRQAFILRCVELEGKTLEQVIQREENYAFTILTRKRRE